MKLFSTLFFACLFSSSFAQVLGIFEFTGVGACPNPSTFVTSQPTGATFSAFHDMGGLTCVVTNNVYNTSGWNPATTIDLTKYYEFAITPDAGKELDLDSLIFVSKISSNTATWYLRSSVDNYAADLATGGSTDVLDTSRILLPASHENLNSVVSFRFYVSSVTDDQRAWRIDDVSVKGVISTNTASVSAIENTEFSVFPNPGKSELNIRSKQDVGAVDLKIFSADGKLVQEIANFDTNTTINTSLLEKGIYHIQINGNGQVSNLSWMKN